MTKKELQEDYDRLDEENTELYRRLIIMQLQDLICEQVRQCVNANYLFKIANYCGTANDMRLVRNNLVDMRFEPREKVGEA